jgi:hypothetical protein
MRTEAVYTGEPTLSQRQGPRRPCGKRCNVSKPTISAAEIEAAGPLMRSKVDYRQPAALALVARGLGRQIDDTFRHVALSCLHRAALSAEMIDFRITALVDIPPHQGKAQISVIFKAGQGSERGHPPVVGLTFCLAANVTSKRYVPNHSSPHTPLVPHWCRYISVEEGARH